MKIVITEWKTLCHDNELSPDIFSEFGEVIPYDYTSDNEVISHIGDADIVLCNKVNITADVIKACPNLKYIGEMATGYNNIDIAAAKNAGIPVCNAGTYSTDAVAQYVIAQILYYYNKIHLYDADVRNDGWIKAPSFSYFPYPAYELRGRTLSIIGYGSIGKQVAKVADAFGMNILVCTRTKPEGCPYELVSMAEAFSRADILTVHTPLTPETKGMVSRENLALMKKNALLINTARGPIVDEKALAEALKEGRIAAAALDVLACEPMLEDTPLRGLSNCTITPHIAWSPFETRKRLMDIAVENLRCYFKGQPRNVVNP